MFTDVDGMLFISSVYPQASMLNWDYGRMVKFKESMIVTGNSVFSDFKFKTAEQNSVNSVIR